jgi:hypothetical protein
MDPHCSPLAPDIRPKIRSVPVIRIDRKPPERLDTISRLEGRIISGECFCEARRRRVERPTDVKRDSSHGGSASISCRLLRAGYL